MTPATCSHCGLFFPAVLDMVHEGPGTPAYSFAYALAGSPNTPCGQQIRAWIAERRKPLKEAYR
jgi:hypothetical protein